MEVLEHRWKRVARSKIDRYLHRGGTNEGNKPQYLRGIPLLNTIGISMGLPVRDPTTWSEREIERALKGELVYYEGKAKEAIEIIANKIVWCCNGKKNIYVTILPIELYFEGKLYELPVFRVSRYENTHEYIVDNVGRHYNNFYAWLDDAKLPPCEMAFPTNLILSADPTTNYARVTFDTTPSGRITAKACGFVDKVAIVAGVGSGVALMFASGGLAAPFVGASIFSGVWGASRAGVQLIDKGIHEGNVNPFTDRESRMLWLGVAASITSFGAMGATMRLSTMAAQGKNISNGVRLFTNVINGSSVALNAIAIIDTAIYLGTSENISASEALMLGISIAFWTKGLLTYKTAGTIIRDAKNFTFSQINNKLSPDKAAEFTEFRNRFQNDDKLLQAFHKAAQNNVPLNIVSDLMIDLMRYSDAVRELSPDQRQTFIGMRDFINDDMQLFSFMREFSNEFKLNPSQTMETIIGLWQETSSRSHNSDKMIRLSDGNMIVGRAPPIEINRLPELSPPFIRFIGEHLSRINSNGTQWKNSVPVLFNLQRQGMFTVCPVTKIIESGRAVISLNNQLQISIFRLESMTADECTLIFKWIGMLNSSRFITSSSLSKDLVDICVVNNRLRLECHRTESIQWIKEHVRDHTALNQIVSSDLYSFEQDRLYTFESDVANAKANLYMNEMISFVAEVKPRNVSEMVALSEFVITYVEYEIININKQLKQGSLKLPTNTKRSVWIRQEASKKVFKDVRSMKQKLYSLLDIVDKNNFVHIVYFPEDLPNNELVTRIRQRTIKFGSRYSAAYHIFKHQTKPIQDYINKANRTIQSSPSYSISLGQEGDSRTITFEDTTGRCLVLEKEGRVLLCSFRPKTQ